MAKSSSKWNIVVYAGRTCTSRKAISQSPAIALMKEVSAQFSAAYTVADFAGVIDALADREIDPTPMLTGHIPLDALPDVFEALRTDKPVQAIGGSEALKWFSMPLKPRRVDQLMRRACPDQ